ncbi:OpgC family protein [Microvirga puerhi]|uniref:OpgC domain-containing protein n=1 Tax=Microvirga puerhi TaxID=2876078 RepID=A0ABS7VRF6_9HYPH|nr:OpgC domain-containing protein [Microvirga puerhi]MBZ6077532.1 OpgC domain-containing protein [Microvirga puerhi]
MMEVHAMKSRERNGTIDFWRGLVLVIIFVNHIPGNIIEHITPRSIGFSDSAEAFIFISGLSLALVYYPKIPQGDIIGVVRRCLRRSFELYRMHLILTAGAIVLFSIGYELSDDIGLIEADGRSAVFGNTTKGITGILLLGHQLGYFNILPLYIALMLWAPVALVLTRIHVLFALAVSFGIYALARDGILALPSWPEPGTWFFNPFAWQLLFTIGIVAGVVFRTRSVPLTRTCLICCLVVVMSSLLVIMDVFGLAPGLRDAAFTQLDLPKYDLGLGRLVHFLAITYLLTQLRVGEKLERTIIGPDLRRLGRNGLMIFAAGSLLSALGQVIMTLTAVKSSASPHIIGMVFTIIGVIGLLALARYLEWNKFNADGPQSGRARSLALPSASPGRLSP